MSLRVRVFLALALMLTGTVLAAWLVAGGAVLRPLIGDILQERLELAIHIGRQVEHATDPRARAGELAEELQVEISRLPERPPRHDIKVVRVLRGGRSVLVLRGKQTPMAVPIHLPGEHRWILVRFPVDLDTPLEHVWRLLLLVAIVAVGAGVGASRWMLRPLEIASEAMQRVAAGDLDHRAPVGEDAAGQMGRTFNHMAERVDALVRGQRQLMAAVSHELRTPLARMRLQVELLADEGASQRRLESLAGDIAEVDALVEELLESARLDQGVLALRRELLPLGEVLAAALAAVDLGARAITAEHPDDMTVFADRRRLVRAITNLLTNIGRYTPDDAQVRLTGWSDDSHDGIDVMDDGPGVPPSEIARLFEPFYRVEQSRSRKTGGLGLGLMLVKQIAEAHHGGVLAENLSPSGLRIRIWVPRALDSQFEKNGGKSQQPRGASDN